jgi:phosphonate ABC transporter permease subunit PhnE
MNNLPQSSLWRSLRVFFLIILVVVVYAYGFQVTQVDLQEAQKPARQEQLVRIIRGLAQPDLLYFDQESQTATAQMQTPCSSATFQTSAAPASGPTIRLDRTCGAVGDTVRVEGSGFRPNTAGSLRWKPPQGEERRLTGIKTDGDGHFSATFTIPKVREASEPQEVSAVVKWNVGLPRPSEALKVTWEKIIETIFLALIATTLGTILSVPISFLAARNLMEQITWPLTGMALSLLAAPIGFAAGAVVFGEVGKLGVGLGDKGIVGVIAWLVSLAVLWLCLRLAAPPGDVPKTGISRLLRLVGLAGLALVGCGSLGLLAGLGVNLGQALQVALGGSATESVGWGFFGNFIFVMADTLNLLLPVIGGLAGLLALSSASGSLGRQLVDRSTPTVSKALSVVFGSVAGAIWFGLIGAGVSWLYESPNPAATIGGPTLVGLVGGGLAALALSATRPVAVGHAIYYTTRTILNTLRAIEPLIMVIVFAVWVGIGPFAGVLALTLHTVAALAKLYSEQVENIMPGPIEAVTATGANRLQTIIYAVIPQIVPPYISFTIYRWDINVRMSTIIGFGGGGGIGFVLQQNINLLQYRQASVMMIAIAIVVASLDYASAEIRKRFI